MNARFAVIYDEINSKTAQMDSSRILCLERAKACESHTHASVGWFWLARAVAYTYGVLHPYYAECKKNENETQKAHY